MKTSTEIASAARIVGERKAVELIAEAGFDAWDFTMIEMCPYDYEAGKAILTDHPLAGKRYLSFARELKRIGLEHGVVCNQSHAPFPSYDPTIRSHLKRAIECTAEAGGSICVIHPCNDGSPQENAEMFLSLLPFAKEHGVKIASENMWNWDREKGESSFAACATAQSFLAHLDAVHDPVFVACLDIGHAEMRPAGDGAAAMIRALGHHLQALHIHDNDLRKDSHQIPFSMKIDFEGVAAALKEMGYNGYLTLEADTYLRHHTPETVLDGLRNMAASAKRLADMMR